MSENILQKIIDQKKIKIEKLKSEIDIINEKLASAEEDEKVLLDERKSLIENFI